MKTLKLNQLEKEVMSNNEMQQLNGGGPGMCGCGCSGPSSTYDNANANADIGARSEGEINMWMVETVEIRP